MTAKRKGISIIIAIMLCFSLLVTFAACAPKTFTVTFELNGGAIEGKDVSVPISLNSGKIINISEYVPQKSGYTFDGYTSGENKYSSTDTITVTSNITLNAKWVEIEKCAVTFELDGGTMENAVTSINKGDTLSFAEHQPTKLGYIFSGWAGADGAIHDISGSLVITANAVFTAQWTLGETAATNFIFEKNGNSYKIVGVVEGFDLETVKIPENYNGMPVSEITAAAFNGCDSIKHLIIGNVSVFPTIKNLKNLESFKITSDKVTTIPNGIFSSSEKIKTIDLSGCLNITEIGGGNFSRCANLEVVNLSGLTKLKKMGDGMFCGNYNPRNSKLKTINFSGCVALETIGQMSFQYLPELKEIDFSECESLRVFERQFFYYCATLETIKLPSGLMRIESDFGKGSDNLKEISVDPLNLWLTSENGILYNYDKTELIQYPTKSEATSYVAPASLKTIRGATFSDALNLTKIDLSACLGLTEIAYSTFSGCKNAVLTVPFDEYGYYQDGRKVSLGSSWNKDVKNTIFAARFLFFDFKIIGISDGLKTDKGTISFTASAKYGDDVCDIAIICGEAVETIMDGKYVVTLARGENKVKVKATFGDNNETKEFKIIYVYAPTVTTTIEDGKVYYGDSLDFDVTAVSGTGVALTKSSVSIKTNWGSGLNDLASNMYTMTDVNGKAHISIDFATLWSWGYYEGGVFNIVIIVTEDGVTAKASYNIEHRAITVDGVVSDYDVVSFDIEVLDGSGNPMTIVGSDVSVSYKDGMTSNNTLFDAALITFTQNGNKLHVSVDVSGDSMKWWGDMTFTVSITVGDIIENITFIAAY